jgi:hypothetical protein
MDLQDVQEPAGQESAARRSARAWKACATLYRARLAEVEHENAALCEEVEELLTEAAAAKT